MALDSALKETADETYYAADFPQFLAPVAIAATSGWGETEGVTTDTDSSYPIGAIYDGHTATWSRPDSQHRDWYLKVALSAASSIDAIFFTVNSFGLSGAAGITVTLKVSDGSTTTTITGVPSGVVDGTSRRFYFPSLQVSGDTGAQRRLFTGVTAVYICFDSGVGNTCRPKVSEVIVGQQRQMPEQPLYPYTMLNSRSTVERAVSMSGIKTLYQFVAGMRWVKAKWSLAYADITPLTSLIADCGGGLATTIVWVASPYLDPHVAYLMVPESDEIEFDREAVNPVHFEIEMTEQGGSLIVDETPTSISR